MQKHVLLCVIATVLALGAGVFVLSMQSPAPGAPATPAATAAASTSDLTFFPTPASSPAPVSAPKQSPPPNSKIYQSATYGFSLYYPNTLSMSVHSVGGNSAVILFQNKAAQEGFQVFVTPYSDPKITQQRFQMDEPSGIMSDPQNITIDRAAATEFFSTNSGMGASREVWFLHGGYLYEVTAPQALDSWLLSILETWQFS